MAGVGVSATIERLSEGERLSATIGRLLSDYCAENLKSSIFKLYKKILKTRVEIFRKSDGNRAGLEKAVDPLGMVQGAMTVGGRGCPARSSAAVGGRVLRLPCGRGYGGLCARARLSARRRSGRRSDAGARRVDQGLTARAWRSARPSCAWRGYTAARMPLWGA